MMPVLSGLVRSELVALYSVCSGLSFFRCENTLFAAPCWGEWFPDHPACCYRYNPSQRVGSRPFWSQCHNALSPQEGQPDQHAHPEGPLLHQKTLRLHPQPGVHVEAGLGWVEQSQQCHLILVLMFVKLIGDWVLALSRPRETTASVLLPQMTCSH